MVDPVEVKLDEIIDYEKLYGEHLKKMEKSFKEDVDYYHKTNAAMVSQGVSGGGGFLENIIKGIGGSRLGSALAGGMAGGITAGVVVGLTNAIIDLTKQSKILGQVHQKLQESVGLLIDMILIPFLPLIFGAMILLYRGIVDFGKVWGDFVKNVQKEGLISMLIKVGLAGTVASWLENMFKWLFGTPQEKKEAQLNFTLSLQGLAGNPLIWSLPWILDLFFGEGTAKGIERTLGIVIDIGGKYLGGLADWIWGIIRWFLEPDTQKTMDLSLRVGLTIASGGDIWTFLTGAASGAANAINASISPSGAPLPGTSMWSLPGAATGGFVEKSGAAIIHQGETITPAGGGGHTFNFYGYDDAKLKASVENILRRQNNRYNA